MSIEDERPRTPGELAELLTVAESTVLRWCREGDIQAFKVAGQWRIPADQVRRILRDGMEEDTATSREAMSEAAKEARREYNRRYREKNRDKIRAQKRQWDKEHAEEIAAYKRQWRKDNPGKKAEYNRRYYEKLAEGQGE